MSLVHPDPNEPAPANDRELVLSRIIDVPREKLFRCWTDEALIKPWFCPPPWKVVEARMDVRAGGSSLIVMEGPDGQRMPNPGIYLEVIPNEKLVFTDAFTGDWVPSGQPFMVGTITFEDLGDGRTLYTARCGHWTTENKAAHEQMGFHQGWGVATEQLAEFASRL